MIYQQHDDHCILRFKGHNWRIQRQRGYILDVCDEQLGFFEAAIDLSHFEFARYAADANRKLHDDWDIDEMAHEVVECSGGSFGTIYAALNDAKRMGAEGLAYDELKRRQAVEREQWMRENPDETLF